MLRRLGVFWYNSLIMRYLLSFLVVFCLSFGCLAPIVSEDPLRWPISYVADDPADLAPYQNHLQAIHNAAMAGESLNTQIVSVELIFREGLITDRGMFGYTQLRKHPYMPGQYTVEVHLDNALPPIMLRDVYLHELAHVLVFNRHLEGILDGTFTEGHHGPTFFSYWGELYRRFVAE